MKSQPPTPEQVRQAFEYLRSTTRQGPPWPATVDELPAQSARRVAVNAVARAIARRTAMAAARSALRPPPAPQPRPLSPAPRHDAKRAAANDRDDEDFDAD